MLYCRDTIKPVQTETWYERKNAVIILGKLKYKCSGESKTISNDEKGKKKIPLHPVFQQLKRWKLSLLDRS